MRKITDRIKEYISSPQVDGNEHYGKWCALTKEQRLLIADLCEYCDLQEKYADTFFKETQSLKHQLAEKDKEIEILKKALEFSCNDQICLTKAFWEKHKQLAKEYIKLAKDQIKQGESKC